MPYGPNSKPQKDKPLTDSERVRRIEKLQIEQERALRRALGDDLFQWLQDFEPDADVLGRD